MTRLTCMSPYLSAIIEQDEAPEMVKHFRGFFVGVDKCGAHFLSGRHHPVAPAFLGAVKAFVGQF